MLKSLGESLPNALVDLPTLDARSVGETAEKEVLSLRLPGDLAFEALYGYLVVDEPAIHLLPLHFLPRSYCGVVEHGALHSLGVAAKLEYARSRWIDEIVDSGYTESLLAVHRLHGALVDLIFAHYSKVLRGHAATTFFQTLAGLYAHHGVSVAVDGSRPSRTPRSLTVEEYSAQSRARNESFRACVDAVLLLTGASAETLRKATEAWQLWVLGAQFYDDALDLEEDFESENLTWTVARTFADLGKYETGDRGPDLDAFYETALVEGALTETLARAESFFRSAERLAEDEFPSWAVLQRACIKQTSKLREDLQGLATRGARG